jgi:hypothetical protein
MIKSAGVEKHKGITEINQEKAMEINQEKATVA